MKFYYRWIHEDSPDLVEALVRKKLQYMQYAGGKYVESRKAIWVFQFGTQHYAPADNIWRNAVLIKIKMKDEGGAIIEKQSNWIDFEDHDNFKGEAKHGDKIIVKNNEPGARGIGQVILETIKGHFLHITQATKEEYAKSLNVRKEQVVWRKWQPPKV